MVSCEQVWQEISDYLDNEIDPTLRSALDAHIGQCPRCTAVVEGTRNVINLYGDERLFPVPMGYSGRLRRRLSSEMRPRRRLVLGWLAATAAVAVASGAVVFERWKSNSNSAMRTEHAQPAKRPVPRELAVLVNTHGKLFHVKGCPFLNQQDEIKAMTAGEAAKQGYVPCPRCLGDYLAQVAENLPQKAGQPA